MTKCPSCDEPFDFVPRGKSANQARNVRPVGGLKLRCCYPTGDDIQSGPIYCGDRATLVADCEHPGQLLAVCARHEEAVRRMAKRTAEKDNPLPTPLETWEDY